MAKKKLAIAFAEAANPEWLIDLLPQYLWEHDEALPARLTGIQIKHVWVSARRVTVLYKFDFNGSLDRTYSHQYVGYFVKNDKLRAEYERTVKSSRILPPFGRAVTLVSAANLVLAAYPNDRKMRLLQAREVASWLPGNLERIMGHSANGAEVIESSIETLRYVPSKRFTSRCSFTLKNGDRALEQRVSFIAKQLDRKLKAKRLYEDLKDLEKACDPSGDASRTFSYPVHIPRPLALFEGKPVVFIEEIPGKNLKRALPEIDLAKTMFDVGALLANFHKIKKPVSKQITLGSEITAVRGAARLIRRTLPQMSREMQEFFRDFPSVEWQDGTPAVLLHGSFRLSHILVHKSKLTVLDLDSIRMGHPAYDIGNFLASLYYLDAQGRFSRETRAAIQRHFLQGYDEHAGFAVRPKAVLWFLASLLINKQAFKYVAHAHEDCEAKAGLMLALARQILGKSRRAPKAMQLQEAGDSLPALAG